MVNAVCFGTTIRMINEEHPQRGFVKTGKDEGLVPAFEKEAVEPGDIYINGYTWPPTHWVVESPRQIDLKDPDLWGLWFSRVRRWITQERKQAA